MTMPKNRPPLPPPKFLPRNWTANRYGVSKKTIERWEGDPALGFPKALVRNGRKYDNVAELDRWDDECAKAGRAAKREQGEAAE
jgi:hypothetical protein